MQMILIWCALLLTGGVLAALFFLCHTQLLRLRLRLYHRRPWYLFCETGRESRLMAESIRRQEPRAVVLFCGQSGWPHQELWRFFRKNQALFSSDSLEQLMKLRCSQRTILLLDSQEQQNLQQLLTLLAYRDGQNQKEAPFCFDWYPPEIYLRGELRSCELLLDSLSREIVMARHPKEPAQLSIRLLDENCRAIWQLFSDYPLYEAWREGPHRISVLILGSGPLALQALQTAVWMGQVKDYPLTIRLMDKDAWQLQQMLQKQSLELLECGEYDIQFIGCDLQTSEFLQGLEQYCSDCNYIIAATPDEDANILLGTDLCAFYVARYGKLHNMPQIAVHVRDPLKSRQVALMQSRDGRYSYDMRAFGSADTLYRLEALRPEQQNQLISTHMTFCQVASEEEYKTALEAMHTRLYSEYSTMVAHLYTQTRLFQCGIRIVRTPGVSPAEYYRQEAEKLRELLKAPDGKLVDELAQWEHIRWNAFMRAAGWQRASLEEMESYVANGCPSYQHYLARLHPYLVPFEQMPDIDRAVLDILGKKQDFQNSDRRFIRCLPDILEGRRIPQEVLPDQSS